MSIVHNIDPSYLRYIHDGLNSGSIHAENASSLPEGLTGLYESTFLGELNVKESQQLLKRFAYFSILKKEVSCQFVAIALDESESEIVDFISTYSKWFNSAQAGKYSIYHERLRTYILSSISQYEFDEFNIRIIGLSHAALANRSNDEWEYYALEHLSNHLFISSMISSNGDALKKLAYDTDHWNRQIEISKGFEWSKKMLNEMMQWAAKYDDEEVIECALNKVDLHHMEQNDAPRIVELVANNDIETALQRIEAFGGNDEEGLQRKFILYMLCLMELTLLGSKDKPFRKDAIEKLLRHLDENMPVDHSVLNWSRFFPSYLMFLMSCEWAEMGLEYLIVYKFTKWWEHNWIGEKGPYNSLEFEILIQTAINIRYEWDRSSAFTHISCKLSEAGKDIESYLFIQNALESARKSPRKRCEALINISIELARQKKISESYLVLHEALVETRLIIDERAKCFYLMLISTQLSMLGNELESKAVYSEAKYAAFLIEDEQEKNLALKALSIELAKQGKLQESLETSNKISIESNKIFALNEIYTELFKLGLVSNEESDKTIKIALDTSRRLKSNQLKCRILKGISINLAKQDKKIFANQVLYEAMEAAYGIIDDDSKNFELKDISTELANQGKFDDSLNIILDMSSGLWKNGAVRNLSTELAKEGKLFQLFEVIVQFLENKSGLCDTIQKDLILKSTSKELASQTRISESLATVHFISDPMLKIFVLNDISKDAMIHDDFSESDVIMKIALNTLDKISDKSDKISAMLLISNELSKHGKILESENMVRALLELARQIVKQKKRICTLVAISSELMNYGKVLESNFIIQEAINMSLDMTDEVQKIFVEMVISTELVKQGKVNESKTLLQTSYESTSRMNNQFWKNPLLKAMCTEFAKQGNIQKALEILKQISDDDWRSLALMDICIELSKLGMSLEILDNARDIGKVWHRSLALKAISVNLAKKSLWNIAIDVATEIPRIDERQECWKEIGKTISELHGVAKAFDFMFNLKNNEAQIYYLKGWVESFSVNDINKFSMKKTLKFMSFDITSIEKMFQLYAMNELFFSNSSLDKINRLSRTINIQWAIDIKNQMPN